MQEITFFVVRYAFAEKKIPWPALLGGILTDPQVMLQNLIGPFTIPRKSSHLDLCCKCCYSQLYKIPYLKITKPTFIVDVVSVMDVSYLFVASLQHN